MSEAAIRRRPPHWVVFGVLLATGLFLEWQHLPGWGLAIFAAIVVAASER